MTDLEENSMKALEKQARKINDEDEEEARPAKNIQFAR